MSHRNFYRRRLPHWHPEGQTFFITFRLANSLPARVIQALQEERERERQIICTQFSGNQQCQELYNLEKNTSVASTPGSTSASPKVRTGWRKKTSPAS